METPDHYPERLLELPWHNWFAIGQTEVMPDREGRESARGARRAKHPSTAGRPDRGARNSQAANDR